MSDPDNQIAFQGFAGAYSELACRNVFPEMEPLACRTFEDAFEAIENGGARLGMIPVDNSVAGRVADIHHILPNSKLYIIAEHFQRVDHHLLAVKGAALSDLKRVHSHVHALNQCRVVIRELDLERVVHADTAGAALLVAEGGDKTQAAIASSLAGERYGLVSLRANIEDAARNTTRFLVMSRDAVVPELGSVPTITSLIFGVRNIPAALFKALGGFATNGVNMTKLESYLVGGGFQAAQFYADVEGHPEDENLKRALEELRYYTREVHILGSYPSHPYRPTFGGADD
jgi:prephenate dehydratase